jgi:hypothetical protein
MDDKNYFRLTSLVLAANAAKRRIIDDFDRYSDALLHEMQKRNERTIERGRIVIRRKPIPVNACRTCGHELSVPLGIDPDHKPERISISMKLDKTA